MVEKLVCDRLKVSIVCMFMSNQSNDIKINVLAIKPPDPKKKDEYCTSTPFVVWEWS